MHNKKTKRNKKLFLIIIQKILKRHALGYLCLCTIQNILANITQTNWKLEYKVVGFTGKYYE